MDNNQDLEYKLKTLERMKGHIREIIEQNARKIESISFFKTSKFKKIIFNTTLNFSSSSWCLLIDQQLVWIYHSKLTSRFSFLVFYTLQQSRTLHYSQKLILCSSLFMLTIIVILMWFPFHSIHWCPTIIIIQDPDQTHFLMKFLPLSPHRKLRSWKKYTNSDKVIKIHCTSISL